MSAPPAHGSAAPPAKADRAAPRLRAVTWLGPRLSREHLTRDGRRTLCGQAIAEEDHRPVANSDGNLRCRLCARVALADWHKPVRVARRRWPEELDVER